MIRNVIGILLIFIGNVIVFSLTEGFLYPLMASVLIGLGGSLIE